MKGKFRRRNFRFSQRKHEYLWVTSQVTDSAVAAATQVNVSLVTGSDWERGTTDARETCTLVRTIIEVRCHWTDLLLFETSYGLLVQDEDEGAVTLNTLAANGNERWLQFGYIPQTTVLGVNSSDVGLGGTGYRHVETKQKVRLGNNDILRFSIRNLSSSVGIVYSLMARSLLMLS